MRSFCTAMRSLSSTMRSLCLPSRSLWIVSIFFWLLLKSFQSMLVTLWLALIQLCLGLRLVIALVLQRTTILKNEWNIYSTELIMIGWGDHFPPHKFIQRSLECWATSIKELLNAGRGHQAHTEAAQSLQKEGFDYWIDCSLSPFDSPFTPLGHLYLLPPSYLLYLTLWISLGVPGCGELFHH